MADYSPPPPPPYGGAPSGEPSLSQPVRGIAPLDAIKRFFKKYATFEGRASRSEFWWVFLFIYVIEGVLNLIFRGSTAGSIIVGLFGLAVLVPYLAVGARRLHDTGRSGWWWLIGLIPCVGAIVLIVFWALPENQEGAKYDVA